MAGQGRRSPGSARPETRDFIKSDGKLGGWELPDDVLEEGEDWHPATRRWWDHWRSSPQAVRMATEPDWDFLLSTALVHHAFWKHGRWEFAAELRMREGQLGANPAARRAMKQEIDVPEEYPAGKKKGANVTSITDRRKRLVGE